MLSPVYSVASLVVDFQETIIQRAEKARDWFNETAPLFEQSPSLSSLVQKAIDGERFCNGKIAHRYNGGRSRVALVAQCIPLPAHSLVFVTLTESSDKVADKDNPEKRQIDMQSAFPSNLFGAVSRSGLLQLVAETRLAREAGAKLKLKYGRTSDAASSLSGGNQQKVVLAKWLARNPKVLLLDEPTRGVDVGAKAEIYAILKDLARDGVALLVVSSEMPELMTLADRILVLAEHEIQGELKRPDFSEENILKLAYGQTPSAGENTQ